jgi:hypothetical protein
VAGNAIAPVSSAKTSAGAFPYGIAYQIVGDAIVVLAIAAHKKRPRHWADRIQR